jgi:hypothetical protein
LISPALGVLTAIFDLNNLPLGKWDVIVKKGATENTLPGAF